MKYRVAIKSQMVSRQWKTTEDGERLQFRSVYLFCREYLEWFEKNLQGPVKCMRKKQALVVVCPSGAMKKELFYADFKLADDLILFKMKYGEMIDFDLP